VSNVNISLSPPQPHIIVATNRYVILDDFRRTGASAGPGFTISTQDDASANEMAGITPGSTQQPYS